jgi:hypothetical protein
LVSVRSLDFSHASADSVKTVKKVPNLLADQPRRTFDALAFLPACEKQLPEEGIERFLDAVLLVAPGILLLLEGGEKPFQDQQSATLRVGFGSGGDEDGRMLGPIGGELDGGFGGEDEGRGGDVGEVAADGCDGLSKGKGEM